jgi:UDPglucose--hexose-1-phosphate uridylyltransferase
MSLSPTERSAFGRALGSVARGYDRIFRTAMPYMMAVHQRPLQSRRLDAHLHVEFYPLLREHGRLKYMAGGEVGAGAVVNDVRPEVAAARLRDALDGAAFSGSLVGPA